MNLILFLFRLVGRGQLFLLFVHPDGLEHVERTLQNGLLVVEQSRVFDPTSMHLLAEASSDVGHAALSERDPMRPSVYGD